MQTINLDTFEVEDKDDEEEGILEVIDLETGEVIEKPAPSFLLSSKPEAGDQSDPAIPLRPDVSGFKPMQSVNPDDQAFLRAFKQGSMNIGGGMLRGIGEVRRILGDEGADKFLQDLEISQNMEQKKTDIITADEPVQRFLGEVGGEVSGFAYGGGGPSTAVKLATGAATSAASGGLSAAGRNKEGADVAIEATIGAVLDPIFQGLGGLREFLKTKKQATELGGVPREIEAIETAAANLEDAVRAQAETGIRTLPAQQTLDPFQLEAQSFIGQNPEASNRAFNVLKEQNREAAAAVGGFLEMIASPRSPSTAPGQARSASNNIIDTAKLIRSEAASPIYKQAFRRQRQGKTPTIDTAQLELKANKIAEQFDPSGQVASNINRVLGKISNAGGDLAKLHNAKIEIDQIIDSRGVDAIGNTTKRFLTDLQNDLVNELTTQSPSYRAARDEFRKNSPLVDELREGVFGRIADLKDRDLKRVSGVVFDASESNPEIVINTIRTLKGVEGGDQIAAGLLRTEIEKRLGRMRSSVGELAETGGRKVENTPANLLNTLFGNAKQKEMLMSALNELNPAAAENAKWLEKSLIRASSGRPGGSQTGIRNVISDDLKGSGIFGAIRGFFRGPIDSIASIGEEASFRRKAAALGEALYNPDWAPDMAKIRRIRPNSEAAQSQFEALLTKIVDTEQAIGLTRRTATVAPRVALDDDEENN